MVRKLAYSVSEREHWISGLGGVVGIYLMYLVSKALLGDDVALIVVSSMGSSAVLLFAMPHAAASQPWPMVGGHLVSAFMGVTCARWLGADPMLAAGLAVGGAITAMYLLRCLNPSGGATAIFAVVGGQTAHSLGYGYLLVPVLLNVVLILVAAVAFNYPFAWRRYPQAWHRRQQAATDTAQEKSMIPHSSLVYALSQLDTFIDVSEEDLQRIYKLALEGAHTPEQATTLRTAAASARA